MQFAAILSGFAMLCIVFCNPLPAQFSPDAFEDMVGNITTKDIDPPQNIGLYICSEPYWNGTCSWAIPEGVLNPDGDAICQTLPYSNSIFISFGPDTAIICKIFRGPKCDGYGVLHEYPGLVSLPRVEHLIFGIFQTYQCHLKV